MSLCSLYLLAILSPKGARLTRQVCLRRPHTSCVRNDDALRATSLLPQMTLRHFGCLLFCLRLLRTLRQNIRPHGYAGGVALHALLCYFLNRYSSGFVEGLNNKLKVIKRRCYGILKPATLFQRLFIDIEWGAKCYA